MMTRSDAHQGQWTSLGALGSAIPALVRAWRPAAEIRSVVHGGLNVTSMATGRPKLSRRGAPGRRGRERGGGAGRGGEKLGGGAADEGGQESDADRSGAAVVDGLGDLDRSDHPEVDDRHHRE